MISPMERFLRAVFFRPIGPAQDLQGRVERVREEFYGTRDQLLTSVRSLEAATETVKEEKEKAYVDVIRDLSMGIDR